MDNIQFPMVDLKSTGREIKALLSEKGVSVKENSSRLGLSSVQAVYKWLRWESILSIDNLMAVSTLLETPIGQFLITK